LTAERSAEPPSVPTEPGPLARAAHLQRLLDVYGPLLTDHQREACRLHLDEDWSFAELAEHLGCSRSGAHDLVRRALAQLEHVEERLGLAAELARRDEVEAALRTRLGHLRAGVRAAEADPGAEPAGRPDVHRVGAAGASSSPGADSHGLPGTRSSPPPIDPVEAR